MTRGAGQKIWLESPHDVHEGAVVPVVQKTKPNHVGLRVSTADQHQGTYLVHNGRGAQWLVARGVDGILDIIEAPADRLAYLPSDRRIISAVSIHIAANERRTT